MPDLTGRDVGGSERHDEVPQTEGRTGSLSKQSHHHMVQPGGLTGLLSGDQSGGELSVRTPVVQSSAVVPHLLTISSPSSSSTSLLSPLSLLLSLC